MKTIIESPLTKEQKIIEEYEDINYWMDKGWIVISRIAENVEDEDFLNGWCYPGHEC